MQKSAGSPSVVHNDPQATLAQHQRFFKQVEPLFRTFIQNVAFHYGYFLDPHLRDDLEQAGAMALWKACQKFDPSIGNFENYARRAISNHIKSAIAELMTNVANWEPLENDDINVDIDGTSLSKDHNDYSDPVFDRVSSLQAMQRITEAISPAQRILFMKMHVEGMTGTEVAKALGVTQQAVSKQYRQIEVLVQEFAAEYQ